jgi:type II secretory pathway pseudopilin PulG
MSSIDQRGASMVVAILAVAILAITATAAWTTSVASAHRKANLHAQRMQLEIVTAIRSYALSSASNQRRLPNTLEQLLQDPRSATLVRHLRAVRLNPLNGTGDWVLIRLADIQASTHPNDLERSEALSTFLAKHAIASDPSGIVGVSAWDLRPFLDNQSGGGEVWEKSQLLFY